MENLNKPEAAALIAQKLKEAQYLVSECEAIADHHKIYFDMNLGDYGMGGSYDGEEGEWNASSESC